MKVLKSKVTIVGAGPAGLSASIQLAEFGIKSTIIDENSNIGGAIFKQPDKGLETSPYKEEKTFIRAKQLFEQFNKYRSYIDLKLGSEVLGHYSLTNELAFIQNNKVSTFSDNPLILCTGCYERAQPFPGWTLPGIMSVGGIQLQAKCGGVQPGKKAVLIGTGPLLLVAAKQLHMAGVKVQAVVEAGLKSDLVKNLFSLFSNTKLLKEGYEYISYLKSHNIPIYYGHGIVNATGDDSLKELIIAPYTKDWKPIKEKSFAIEVDCAGIGYGYVPRIQLTQMLSCKHNFDATIGGFYPKIDNWQRTSQKGVYVAGDGAGIYGSEVAINQGKIAALAYLTDTNEISKKEAQIHAKKIFNKIKKLKKFQGAFDKFSTLKNGLLTLPREDTIICRCENIKQKDLDEAIHTGAKDMMDLKMRARIGMGDCQGKMCGSFCAEYLANKLQCSREEIGVLKPRFPIVPIPFESITEKELEYEK